jgi:hypothetical protein
MHISDWKAFIWTDEMSVKVGMERSTRAYWVWRKADEEFHPDCIDYKKHATVTWMMFWVAFRWGRMGPGVVLGGVTYRSQLSWKTMLLSVKRSVFRSDKSLE